MIGLVVEQLVCEIYSLMIKRVHVRGNPTLARQCTHYRVKAHIEYSIH